VRNIPYVIVVGSKAAAQMADAGRTGRRGMARISRREVRRTGTQAGSDHFPSSDRAATLLIRRILENLSNKTCSSKQ
jgi:hypothetical protein